MKNKINSILVITGAILFTLLFHHQTLGLNLAIFEMIFFLWLVASKQVRFRGKNMIAGSLGFIVSCLSIVITHSTYCIIINFLAFLVFAGLTIYPQLNSYSNALWLGVTSVITSQLARIDELINTKTNKSKIWSWLWRSRVFVAPIGIIFFFIAIYSFSNPIFGDLTEDITNFINRELTWLFKDFDSSMILTFCFGIVVCVFLVYKTTSKYIIQYDIKRKDELIRIKTPFHKRIGFIALKNEYRAGIFLLLVLNVILLVLNIIDIESVWINFTWDGMYLKEFVHVGTYLLIVSILISMAIVLYFFRNNLNFYSKNKWLKYLSYIWLMQNGILVISLTIRNFWYIYYFSLAYKRIGVIIFLIATIVGLITIFLKVYKKKSASYLIKTNAFALHLILVVSSIFNWDSVIAKYNFNNSNHAFVHFNYLSTLPDHTLPDLDVSLEELKQIDSTQKDMFWFNRGYMSPEKYHEIIQDRKNSFKYRWEHSSWQEWNLPDYLAYQKLFDK